MSFIHKLHSGMGKSIVPFANKKDEFLYLTTIGHRSGREHEIEIWFVERDGCYYLVAERGARAHWVQNIRAHPRVRFWVRGVSYDGRGRSLDEMTDGALIAEISALMDAKYGWSDGLIVELCPS